MVCLFSDDLLRAVLVVHVCQDGPPLHLPEDVVLDHVQQEGHLLHVIPDDQIGGGFRVVLPDLGQSPDQDPRVGVPGTRRDGSASSERWTNGRRPVSSIILAPV